jgi:hypothetical protein
MPERKWYTVTFRGTAEMVVWVEAESATEARQLADDAEYDDATDVEFVKGKPYTMKAKLALDYAPPEEWERHA